MSFLEGNSISLLAELLRQPDEPSTDEEDDRLPAAGIHRFGNNNFNLIVSNY